MVKIFIILAFGFLIKMDIAKANSSLKPVIIAQDTANHLSAEAVVEMQLKAYNEKNIEAFLALFSDNIKGFTFPDKEIFSGKNTMRAGYEAFFKENPNFHCEVINRMAMKDTVVDHQKITGLKDGKEVTNIVIFRFKEGKIHRVYFVNQN